MDITYTVEIRRDTGLTNGKIGIWLFLASEVMLFGALFASYILIRTGAPSWPRGSTIGESGCSRRWRGSASCASPRPRSPGGARRCPSPARSR